MRFLVDTWRKFSRDNGMILAAAVSFYEFLALFPLLLATVGILGVVLRSPHSAELAVSRVLRHFFITPQGSRIVIEITTGSTAATGIGIFLLLWSGMSAVVALESAMNIAWGVRRKRGFLKIRGIALLTLALAGILLAITFGITVLLAYIREASSSWIAHASAGWTAVGYIVAVLASIALFVMLYKLLPNTRVPWKAALVAGTFAGILWEIAKLAFTYYAAHFAGYNKVYGSLAGVILILIWIDYTSIITIFGAELAGKIAGVPRERESV